ncbi:MAG: tryptophan--tRNA ligase [Oscillospiraceae bacterium]
MTDSVSRPRVFSGIQPTGGFTLGNYLGAVRNWGALQDDYDCIYCVVDLHSLTIRREPAELRRQIKEAAAMLIACGVDPKRSILYIQGDVHEHAELSWILSCYTQFGELSRMTQFKDKSEKHPENINGGLFTYPVLMAADILLYNTNLVPIGADQKQHLEIARDIALRFNGIYGDVFTIPEGYFPKVGARVMSLQQPDAKMSKSDENVNAKIMLTDSSDDIIRKFKRAVTDSESEVRASENKPGVLNLMTIYSALTSKSFGDIESEFDGRGYGDFKLAVGESVADTLRPIQEEYRRLVSDNQYLEEILSDGAERAGFIAKRTLQKVRKKVGLERK